MHSGGRESSTITLGALLIGLGVGAFAGCGGDAPPGDAMVGTDGSTDAGPRPCADEDGDGYLDAACGGDDCDDTNAARNPGAPETCDSAGLDEDCNPVTFAGPEGDTDGDGYTAAACCNTIGPTTTCGSDCDDGDPGVNPAALDGCGGGDEDCDDDVDENPDQTYYRDADNDAFGVLTDTLVACTAPAGYVVLSGDCDDARMSVNPGATEVCEGSIDENCDLVVDEECACTAGAVDTTCGSPTDEGICSYGMRTCGADGTWGPCAGAVPPASEVCDAAMQDENCDGTANEGCECVNGAMRDCVAEGATSTTYPSICTVVPQSCVDGHWPRACADAPLQGPQTEVCDPSGRDEDCDGMANEGCMCTGTETRSCGTDRGECTVGTQQCASGAWGTCSGTPPRAEVCDHRNEGCNLIADLGVSTDCVFGTTEPFQDLECASVSSCPALGNQVELGWPLILPWAPTSGAAERVVAYTPDPIDFGLLGFNVQARVSLRKPNTGIGDGAVGVLMSPRNVRGSNANNGLPVLQPGEQGWAAVYFTLVHQLYLYELRPDAAPISRGNVGLATSCANLSPSARDFYVELDITLGVATASVQASGCSGGVAEVAYTLPGAQYDALRGQTASYPTYYAGAVGNDRSGGTYMTLERFDIGSYYGCSDECSTW